MYQASRKINQAATAIGFVLSMPKLMSSLVTLSFSQPINLARQRECFPLMAEKFPPEELERAA